MEFTGERFTPDCVREIWYEHWHRYAFALEFVAGKRVLDLACGEGYGSHLLASRAGQVTGIDLSEAAIAHALETYQHPALDYQQGDATAIPLADDSIDVVVSFETLEHLSPQDQMLAEFRRVLRPDGLLIISTPDKRVYSQDGEVDNPYHVKELYREEFEALLQRHFPAWRMFGQKLTFQSLIWAQDEDPNDNAGAVMFDNNKLEPGPAVDPMYYIAIAAADASLLPTTAPGLHLFADRAESVYQHYNHEIRKNIQAGTILAERDAELAELRARPATSIWRRLIGK